MTDILMWFTDLGNSKIAALIIFFVTFVGIVLYVYTGKERTKRLESYRFVPFLDEDDGPRSDMDIDKVAPNKAPKKGEK